MKCYVEQICRWKTEKTMHSIQIGLLAGYVMAMMYVYICNFGSQGKDARNMDKAFYVNI